MAGGSRSRNESGESKKEVFCGICGTKSRRDNMKAKHFPKVHPGQPYRERGESQTMNTFFAPNQQRIASGDEDMDGPETLDEAVSGQVPSDSEQGDEEIVTGTKRIEEGIESIAKQLETISVKLDNKQEIQDNC